jgi:hypothetical protein
LRGRLDSGMWNMLKWFFNGAAVGLILVVALFILLRWLFT